MTAARNLPDPQDWTVHDLASLPKDLRYELIDGRLILPCPTGFHQILGIEVVLALRAQCPPDYAPVTDLSLKINERNEPRPDVVVVPVGRLNRSPVPAEDAILVVEIISADSHFRDMHAKTRVYAAAGIARYWVIDPLFEDGIVLTEFQPDACGEYEIVSSTDKVFVTDVPFPVTIDLPALTERRKAVLDRTRLQ
jgi:Uma2 family endonuclease